MSLTFLQFSHKSSISCSICSNLSFYQVILKCYFKNPCFQLQQNVLWTNEIMRVTFASTGINGVSLAHYISYTSMVTYLFFNVFFETDIVKFTLKVNPQGTRPTNMQLVLMYSTDWMLVRHFCDALVYKDIRNLLKILFIYSWAQDKTEYQTMEFHTLMLYHWAIENSL